jgi:hypothetical protein
MRHQEPVVSSHPLKVTPGGDMGTTVEIIGTVRRWREEALTSVTKCCLSWRLRQATNLTVVAEGKVQTDLRLELPCRPW